jgi:REP-associated tyrosine transposase
MKIEYHNLYIHFILVTQNGIPFIREKNRDRIEKYIAGVVNNCSSTLYNIYANPEYTHLPVSRSPKLSEETLVIRIADSSAKFINVNRLTQGLFAWQESASAFLFQNQRLTSCKYILNQPEHHRKVTFAEEYEELVKYYQKTLKWEISQ